MFQTVWEKVTAFDYCIFTRYMYTSKNASSAARKKSNSVGVICC